MSPLSTVEGHPNVRHFSFRRATLQEAIAHNGSAPILSDRILEGGDSVPWSFVDLVRVPPHADIGLHTHAMDNEEMYIVVSGVGQMHVDGEEFIVCAGDVIVNRPGGSHGLTNIGETALDLVVVEVRLR